MSLLRDGNKQADGQRKGAVPKASEIPDREIKALEQTETLPRHAFHAFHGDVELHRACQARRRARDGPKLIPCET